MFRHFFIFIHFDLKLTAMRMIFAFYLQIEQIHQFLYLSLILQIKIDIFNFWTVNIAFGAQIRLEIQTFCDAILTEQTATILALSRL